MCIYQNLYEITLTAKEFRRFAEHKTDVIEIPREELNIHDHIKIHLQDSDDEILCSIKPHSDAFFGSLTKAFVRIKEVKRNF